jgi:uncharacterized protein YkwD|tara:strand:+ start:285 stop:800 length:516 start_codon:yes stop_codon:yes gene_type:complete
MKYIIIILLTFICNLGHSQNLSNIENHLLNLVNEERSNRGLSTFVTDPLINDGAKIQANYLSTIRSYKQVSHTNPNLKYKTASDRIKIASNSKYTNSSENVTAFTYDSSKTDLEIATQAHNNFMNSKYHKMNVLTEYGDYLNKGYILPSHYGHHIVYNKKLNAIIVVQMFP